MRSAARSSRPGFSCRATRMRRGQCTRSRPSGRWRRVVPYRDASDAMALARRGGGSLAASIFSADEALAGRLVLGLAPYHGRILVVNAACAKESTGHGSPLAPLVHGGPGRAGGGEELGGIRGVLHYMQRTAVQGTPDVITALGGRWVRGSRQRDPGRHPFRIAFDDLVLGDTFRSAERAVTIEDIEPFAALIGRQFLRAHERARGRPQSAVRRPRGARLFPDFRGRGIVRRSGLRSGARQLRARSAALREAGQARRADQGASHLRAEEPARRQGMGRGRLGHGDHQSGRRDRRLLRRAHDGEHATRFPIVRCEA